MKPQPAGNDFAAFIGIDWADAKHDICLQAAHAARRESSVLPHRPDAIEAWTGTLRQRFQGRPIAVCLELTKGPLVYALQKYDFLVLFPVHPATLAKYRQAFTPSQAKDDPTDAELQLELLLRHRDKLKPLHPQGAAMRTLQYLVEQRRRLVGDKGRITNRLIYALKQYFPQALEWFKDKDTVVFCDFLSRWPTLKQAKHARKGDPRGLLPGTQCALPTYHRRATAGHQNRHPTDRGPRRHHAASTPRSSPRRTVAREPCRPSSASMPRPLRSLTPSPTIRYSVPCRAPAPPSHLGCSPPSVNNESATTAPRSSKSTPVSHPSPNAAARNSGCTGDYSAPSSYAKRSSCTSQKHYIHVIPVRRMGRGDHPSLVLGRCLLSAAA